MLSERLGTIRFNSVKMLISVIFLGMLISPVNIRGKMTPDFISVFSLSLPSPSLFLFLFVSVCLSVSPSVSLTLTGMVRSACRS